MYFLKFLNDAETGRRFEPPMYFLALKSNPRRAGVLDVHVTPHAQEAARFPSLEAATVFRVEHRPDLQRFTTVVMNEEDAGPPAEIQELLLGVSDQLRAKTRKEDP